MHELLHATDMMKFVAGLGVLEISSKGRHEEIYRLQNQTLYDLTGTVDKSFKGHPVTDPYRYTGPKF